MWSDADGSEHPEHPRPIGLATAPTREAALVKGVSDRLGWEAVLEFERGADLPKASAVTDSSGANAIVLDGRLDHDVPTVVVLAADTMRWGAGSTWNGAMRRALYGEDPAADPVERARRTVPIFSPPAVWRLPVSISALPGCMLPESFVAPCRSSRATARYGRGTLTE